MRVELTLRRRDEPDREVALEAPPHAVLADLQGVDPAWSAPRTGWWSGTRRLAPDAAIGGPGLRNGDIVGVGQVGQRDTTGGAVLLLRAVCGPDSGALWALPAGTAIIGRADDVDVRLIDGDVSRRHASLSVTAAGVHLRDLDSTNGVLLDGRPIGPQGAALRPDQLIQVGGAVLCLSATLDAPAAVRPHEDGRLLVNRPPRLPPDDARAVVALPEQPRARPLSAPRIAATILPAALAVAVASVLHSRVFLLLALLSPVAVLGGMLGDRLAARRGRRRESRAFRRDEAVALAERDRQLAAEAARRRRAHPDPAAVRLIARGPTSRLWERRGDDPDFLDVRVGLGDGPARLQLTRAGRPLAAPTVPLIPRCANLRDGPLGICGSMLAARAAARWAVLQVAALHSAADVRVVALLGEEASEHWRWLRWLPHTQSLAADAASRRALVQQLAGAVDASPDRARDPAGRRPPGPWTVIVLDRAGDLAATPGLARLLHDPTQAGITAICVDESTRRLPPACASVLRLDLAAAGAVLVGPAQRDGARVMLDGLRPEHAEEAARQLAPLGDLADESSALPPAVRLTDVVGRGAFSPIALGRTWAAADGVPRTALGRTARGTYEVDLLRDGPHALVAGTTGSGKSELLQSLVAGLAAACSPEDLTFVLIDYKGGAAFAQCAELPHTAGLVTDLDQALSERALRSLHAELRRREELLAGAGAPDLVAYRARRPDGGDALPRIVLVVDEFAALAEELPAFIGGLIGVAQRGRSLGVHLVLATQRPGGVVSPEIRANTNLRIALRVTDPAESRDIVGVDDAAHLPRATPGRALVRIGASEDPPFQMQTAHVGARSRADDAAVAQWLDSWGRPIHDAANSPPDADSTSELEKLVRGAREAARTMAPARAPWCAPLPDLLPPAQTDRLARPGFITLGLLDLPDEQAQAPLRVALTGGTTLIVGAARSGRTSALRSAARQVSADRDSELHALDCGAGQLRTLRDSRRCGIFAGDDDIETMRAALARLRDVLSARRASGAEHPCVVLIDGVDIAAAALDSADPGRGADHLVSLLRDAESGGLTVIATADRPALAGRLGSVFATKVLLRLNEPADYALAGIPTRLVPTRMGPGRGLLAPTGDVIQLAILDANPLEQDRLLSAALAAPRSADAPPMTRLRALPRRVELRDLPCATERAPGDIALGAGGDSAQTMLLRLLAPQPARMLIVGPPGSGRSSTLALIADQLQSQRIPAALIAEPGRTKAAAQLRIPVLDPHSIALPDLAELAELRVVLIDDCPALGATELGSRLAELVLGRPDIAFVGAGRADELAAAFRGVGMVLARFRSGVLLCPAPTDPDLFSLRLPRVRAPFLPGRGILVGAGPPTPIQVAALPEPRSPQSRSAPPSS